jgi:diguanylate cyclase (GGDEF)-like protein
MNSLLSFRIGGYPSRMKNKPEVPNLRRSFLEGAKTLAVLRASGGDPLALESGIDLIRGEWEGVSAVALVDARVSPSPRETYENDLKSLHEISFELSLCDSVDNVCRDSVRLGMERLGFDRLGIWLIDQKDPRWKLGTWSTGEEGTLRDERGSRLLRKPGDVPSSFYEGREALLFDKDAIHRDFDGCTVARGNKLLAPLWDGHTLIGEVGLDDLQGHEGFCLEKREVFVIFARIVANLISLKRAESELKLLASTDPLTGTVNRRTALIILEKQVAHCYRSGAPLTICLADLDGLKIVNDAYGHAAGDDYIRRASSTLVGAVRSSDTVGRIGGDEFLIVFPDCRGEVVASILDRVNAEMAKNAKITVAMSRLSWGIASIDELAIDKDTEGDIVQRCIDMLLELADQRMYDDKRSKGVSRPRSISQQSLAL